jgi:hypothetical protein
VISFRYHLVSVIAVFLALAVGIVVGTTALNGPITKDLRRQLDAARASRDASSAEVKALRAQAGDAGRFAATYGSQLVGGTLSGKKVLVIALPGVGAGEQQGVSTLLAAAGATSAGVLQVSSAFVDPANGQGIVSLAAGPSHPVGWTAPRTSDAGQLAGSLLAYVLLGKGQQTDLSQVLGGFAALHMIAVQGAGDGAGNAAGTVTPTAEIVVLTKGAPRTQPTYADAAELALVTSLSSAGGHVVVAGDAPSAASGGLVKAVRGSGTARSDVATVDDADTPFGSVATVLALAAATKGQVGQYGEGQGADALFPPPAR